MTPPVLSRSRRAVRRRALRAKLAEMALPLAPLVQITTGRAHPDFPLSMLHFWLLVDGQLQSLAEFYHQAYPNPLHDEYPCPVAWSDGLPTEEKRRLFGQFIGLRGCDTPPPSSPRVADDAYPVPPTLVARAPGCCGACRWHVDMLDGPSYFCLACAGSAPAASPTASSTASPTAARSLSRVLSSPRLHVQARVTRRSTSPSRRMRPLTVEEVIEAAQRARLDDDASEQALRNKMGYYR